MAAMIALRAPVELPFELGYTWLEDLDANFEVIPPDTPHAARSKRCVTLALNESGAGRS